MTTLDARACLLHRLDEVQRLCPDMRIGQFLATVAMLGEESTGRTLWDIEDEELLRVMEKHRADLLRRQHADA